MNLDRPTAPDPYTLLPQVPAFEVTSPGFADRGELPADASLAGANRSPALSWRGLPEGTRSLVVTCYDPDAPTPSGFWHWCVVGLPGDLSELPEGAGSEGGSLPESALTLRNDFGSADFGGAAPPPGDRPHRYLFAVTALDTSEHGVDDATSPAKAHFLTLEHVLGRGVITGMYAEPA